MQCDTITMHAPSILDSITGLRLEAPMIGTTTPHRLLFDGWGR